MYNILNFFGLQVHTFLTKRWSRWRWTIIFLFELTFEEKEKGSVEAEPFPWGTGIHFPHAWCSPKWANQTPLLPGFFFFFFFFKSDPTSFLFFNTPFSYALGPFAIFLNTFLFLYDGVGNGPKLTKGNSSFCFVFFCPSLFITTNQNECYLSATDNTCLDNDEF